MAGASTRPDRRRSFCVFASWYSLCVPFLGAAGAFMVLHTIPQRIPAGSARISEFDHIVIYLLVVLASSFILGLGSLFGARRYKSSGIFWRGLAGVVVSCGTSVLAVIADLMQGLIC